MHLIRAQPLPARQTFRVDALNGPAGKILHLYPQNFSAHPLEKLAGFCGNGVVVSRKKPQLVVGTLQQPAGATKQVHCQSGSGLNFRVRIIEPGSRAARDLQFPDVEPSGLGAGSDAGELFFISSTLACSSAT